ncbi:MAG TPA: transaldolase family protein [Aggregatilineales bacterium]|nr:transaldolase family protein [Aggregatilineales bacterium]
MAAPIAKGFKNPLHQTVNTTPTDYWNDSCSIEELTYAIDNGAVGATSNPTIVVGVLKKEMPLWHDRILQIIRDNPTWAEDQITWKLIEEMAVKGANLLFPVYQREKGKKGRLSIQTNPAFYRNADAILEQATHFSQLAPNMQVKIPVTAAGIAAIEEATYRGVSINATVCFCVPQALAVGEAVEKGLKRREAEGRSIAEMSPVCTIMIGRMDDWIHVLEKRDAILVTPGYPDWAGIACLKKAYGIFHERGYRARLLAAAYRHHMHWSELIGGDIVLTIPYEWQKLFNASDIEVKERFFDPVPQHIVNTLYAKFADFRRAYDVDGLPVKEFDSFGPTVRTLRSFISSYHELVGIVRDFMLPNPDVK